jgi:hypothetical protein
VKKRAPKNVSHRITPAAVAAFVAGDDDALGEALGLTAPWQDPPLPPLGEASPWPQGTAGAEWWAKGQELHRALIEAAAERDGDA